MEADFDSLL